MNSYFLEFPRDFDNEYTVYVVDTPQAADALRKAFPNARRCTRDKAIRRGWTLPRQAKQDGEQWFGWFCEPWKPADQPQTMEQAIERAKEATVEAIENALVLQDADKNRRG